MDSDDRLKATGRVFHLTPEPSWHAATHADSYVPEAYAQEGFVHCTREESDLLGVANRYYRGDDRPYLVLEIDLTRVRAAAIYEDPDRRYPHVYGPIELNAVVGVRGMVRADDGTFTALGGRGKAGRKQLRARTESP